MTNFLQDIVLTSAVASIGLGGIGLTQWLAERRDRRARERDALTQAHVTVRRLYGHPVDVDAVWQDREDLHAATYSMR